MKKFGVILFAIAMMFALNGKSLRSEPIQHFDMAGTLQLGLALPMGDWSDFWGTSFGALGSFEYRVAENISALASIGFIQWSQLNETYENFNYYSIPIQVAGHYYFSSTKDFRPYGGLELGVHMMKLEVDNHTYRTVLYEDTYLAVSPLIGALIPFGQDDFFLNAAVKYSTVMTEGSSSGYFALFAGITYPF
jgi:hypothetical protein